MFSESHKFDDLERAVLQSILESREINISQISAKLGEPKANVHRRVQHLEDERIINSQYIGRQRLVSLNPAAIDRVRGAIGIVPAARVLALVSSRHAKDLFAYFKPHETIFLTTEPEIELEIPKVRKIVLPSNLGECYKHVYDLIREEKVVKNSYVAIGITGNGMASIAAGMVARDTATPILIVEDGKIRQIL